MQGGIVKEVREYIVNEYPKEKEETEEEHEELINERVDSWLNCNYDCNIFNMEG